MNVRVHSDTHARDHARTNKHTGLGTATAGPSHAGHGMPETSRGLATPGGPCRLLCPMPRGGQLGPPLLLVNSSKFRPSPGHAGLRNPASTAGPSRRQGSVSRRAFPEGKACLCLGSPSPPGFPLLGDAPSTPRAVIKDPLGVRFLPSPFCQPESRTRCHHLVLPAAPQAAKPACTPAGAGWILQPWAVALGGRAECRSQAGVGSASSP